MKVNVSCDWGGTIPSYEFKRDVPLADHIATICSELKATDAPENYALFVESTFTYVRPEVPSSLSLLLSGLPFCRIMDERESSVLPLLSSFCHSSFAFDPSHCPIFSTSVVFLVWWRCANRT